MQQRQARVERLNLESLGADAALWWEHDDGVAEEGNDEVGDAVPAEHVVLSTDELCSWLLFLSFRVVRFARLANVRLKLGKSAFQSFSSMDFFQHHIN